MGVTRQRGSCQLSVRIGDYGDFHTACYADEFEVVLFLPYSGEVVIASVDAIAAFEAADSGHPGYQKLCKTLGHLGVNIG